MMARYGQITRSSLFLQHQFFIERCKTAETQRERAEALKKAATTRRMLAHDPTLRHWISRENAA